MRSIFRLLRVEEATIRGEWTWSSRQHTGGPGNASVIQDFVAEVAGNRKLTHSVRCGDATTNESSNDQKNETFQTVAGVFIAAIPSSTTWGSSNP